MMQFKRPSNDVLRVLVLVILALVIVPNVFGQGADIIIPGPINDNFSDAQSIALNSSYTTAGELDFASTEATEMSDPDLATCSMRRTVWYIFTAAFDGDIALSTQGSKIETSDENYSQDTSIAVYTGTTLANLTEVACNSYFGGALGQISSMEISQGTTYYVRVGVGTGLDLATSGGYLKLTTVVLGATNYAPVTMLNGFFSVPLVSIFGGWTVKNAFNGDGIEAEAFKFYGGPSETTKIVQKAAWHSHVMKARVDHMLELDVDVDTISGTPNLKIALTVQYSDGTAPSKNVLKLTDTFDDTADLVVFFTSPNVSNVKIVIGNKASAGSITVDNISLDYDGGIFRTESAPVAPLALPLPQY